MNKLANIPEFGIKRESEERRDGGCAVVFNPKNQQYAVNKINTGEKFWLFSGGVEEDEDIKDGVLREVREESGLYNFLYVEKIGEAIAHYHNTLKDVNRFAYTTCFLVILKDDKLQPTQFEEHEKFTLVFTTAEKILSNLEFFNTDNGRDHWIYFFKKCVNRAIELKYDKTSTSF